MLGNAHKREAITQFSKHKVQRGEEGGWGGVDVDPTSFPLSHPHKIFSP
jgi:hypothetical protein